MFDFDSIRRWNDWANRTVFSVLVASEGEPPNALAAFQHILEAEVTWLRRIVGHPEPNIPLWGDPSLELCAVLLNESRELIAGLREEALDTTVTYYNSQKQSFKDVPRTMLTQALFHSSQYRGEAAAFLNAAGHTVPDIDFILWLRTRAREES